MQLKAFSNEAASWLKYEEYVREVSRFQKALDCANTALEALDEEPSAWKPTDAEMARVLYRKALALEGLGNMKDAAEGAGRAHEIEPGDQSIGALVRKIEGVRQMEQ